ncbi:hypothetical protein [Rhodanobacter sp. FW106-PBR-R2A-1-13]
MLEFCLGSSLVSAIQLPDARHWMQVNRALSTPATSSLITA